VKRKGAEEKGEWGHGGGKGEKGGTGKGGKMVWGRREIGQGRWKKAGVGDRGGAKGELGYKNQCGGRGTEAFAGGVSGLRVVEE